MGNIKNKKPVLGKGLNSIFLDLGVQKIDENQQEQIVNISIDKIRENPFQPRKIFIEDEIISLAQSIEQQGLLQPILLREHSDFYQIIAGERRFKAFQKLKRKIIPACIRQKISDRQMMEISIIENIQRVQLNVMEEAKSYFQLIKKCGLTHQELADKLSKSRSYISNVLRLLKLDDFVQQLVLEQKISMGAVRVLITLPPKEQIIKVKNILAKNMNVRDVEKEINTKNKKFKNTKINNKIDVNLKSDLNELQYFIGSIVELKGDEQKGIVSFKYDSKEELEQIINRILFKNKN